LAHKGGKVGSLTHQPPSEGLNLSIYLRCFNSNLSLYSHAWSLSQIFCSLHKKLTAWNFI